MDGPPHWSLDRLGSSDIHSRLPLGPDTHGNSKLHVTADDLPALGYCSTVSCRTVFLHHWRLGSNLPRTKAWQRSVGKIWIRVEHQTSISILPRLSDSSLSAGATYEHDGVTTQVRTIIPRQGGAMFFPTDLHSTRSLACRTPRTASDRATKVISPLYSL